MYDIFTHIQLIFIVNVYKYTSPMDSMGWINKNASKINRKSQTCDKSEKKVGAGHPKHQWVESRRKDHHRPGILSENRHYICPEQNDWNYSEWGWWVSASGQFWRRGGQKKQQQFFGWNILVEIGSQSPPHNWCQVFFRWNTKLQTWHLLINSMQYKTSWHVGIRRSETSWTTLHPLKLTRNPWK